MASDSERDRILRETQRALKSEKSRRKTLSGAGFATSSALTGGKPGNEAGNDADVTGNPASMRLLAQLSSMLSTAFGGASDKRPSGGGAQSHAATGGAAISGGKFPDSNVKAYIKVAAGTLIDTEEKARSIIVAMKQDKPLAALMDRGRFCMCCSYLAGRGAGSDHKSLVCKAKTQAALAYAKAHPDFNSYTARQ